MKTRIVYSVHSTGSHISRPYTPIHFYDFDESHFKGTAKTATKEAMHNNYILRTSVHNLYSSPNNTMAMILRKQAGYVEELGT
jgi:hypothetical protein